MNLCWQSNVSAFTTQGLNLGLLHHRQILHQLSHQGRPFCFTGYGQLLYSCPYLIMISDSKWIVHIHSNMRNCDIEYSDHLIWGWLECTFKNCAVFCILLFSLVAISPCMWVQKMWSYFSLTEFYIPHPTPPLNTEF